MKLYFGNAVTTATTLMILALLGFIGWSVFNRANIQYTDCFRTFFEKMRSINIEKFRDICSWERRLG